MPSATRTADRRFRARAVRAFTLRVPADEIFDFIHDPEGLERVIRPAVKIEATSQRTFVFRGGEPGEELEWEAEILAETAPKEISWECRQAGKRAAAGAISFQPGPGDEGTELRVVMEYNPTGGRMGAWLSRHHPAGLPHALNECLRRIKALLEAGEIPTTEGQPTGARRKGRT